MMQKIFANKTNVVLAGLVVAVLAFAVVFGVSLAAEKDNTSVSCNEPCVRLTSQGAQPDILTVVPGTYVEFVSADGKKHSMSLGEHDSSHKHTEDDHQTLVSGEFSGSEVWRAHFEAEGTYPLSDDYNRNIQATVVVTPATENSN